MEFSDFSESMASSKLSDKIFGHFLSFLLGLRLYASNSELEVETQAWHALCICVYSRERRIDSERPDWLSAGVQSLSLMCCTYSYIRNNNSLLRPKWAGGGGGNQTKTSSPSFTIFYDATNGNCSKKAEKHLPPAKDNLYNTEIVMLCLGLAIWYHIQIINS